jgi:hypothetical protein
VPEENSRKCRINISGDDRRWRGRETGMKVLKERDNWEGISVDGRIIIKLILGK